MPGADDLFSKKTPRGVSEADLDPNQSAGSPIFDDGKFKAVIDQSDSALSPEDLLALKKVFQDKEYEAIAPQQTPSEGVIGVPAAMLQVLAKLEREHGSIRFQMIYPDALVGNRALLFTAGGEDLILKMSIGGQDTVGFSSNDHEFLSKGYKDFPELKGTIRDESGEVIGVVRTYTDGMTLTGLAGIYLKGLQAREADEGVTVLDTVTELNSFLETYREQLEELFLHYAKEYQMLPVDPKGDNLVVVYHEHGDITHGLQYFDTSKFLPTEDILKMWAIGSNEELAKELADSIIEQIKHETGFSLIEEGLREAG